MTGVNGATEWSFPCGLNQCNMIQVKFNNESWTGMTWAPSGSICKKGRLAMGYLPTVAFLPYPLLAIITGSNSKYQQVPWVVSIW